MTSSSTFTRNLVIFKHSFSNSSFIENNSLCPITKTNKQRRTVQLPLVDFPHEETDFVEEEITEIAQINKVAPTLFFDSKITRCKEKNSCSFLDSSPNCKLPDLEVRRPQKKTTKYTEPGSAIKLNAGTHKTINDAVQKEDVSFNKNVKQVLKLKKEISVPKPMPVAISREYSSRLILGLLQYQH